MGSPNFNAPSLKLTLTAIGAVVGLHLLTAVALTMVNTPVPVVKAVAEPPPIEIQMISVTAEPPPDAPKPEDKKLEDKKPAAVKVKSITAPAPASNPKPVIKPNPKPKPVAPVEKPTKPEKVAPTEQPEKIKPVSKVKPKIIQQETPDSSKPLPFEAEMTAIEQRRIATEQAAKDAKQLAQDTAARDAKAKSEAEAQQARADAKAARDAQADADNKAAKTAARNAQAAADAKAKADAAAASNTPVNFTASNANWANTPNFSFPSRASRRANSGDTFNVVLVLRVNKQGGIDSVRVAQSSGNPILDKEAQRQVRSGKFRPFMKDGVPVVGNVTLPISYAVP